MVAQRGQLFLLRQGAQVPQPLLGCVQAVSGGRLDEAGEDRLQCALGEQIQDLDSSRRGDGECGVGNIYDYSPYNMFACVVLVLFSGLKHNLYS